MYTPLFNPPPHMHTSFSCVCGVGVVMLISTRGRLAAITYAYKSHHHHHPFPIPLSVDCFVMVARISLGACARGRFFSDGVMYHMYSPKLASFSFVGYNGGGEAENEEGPFSSSCGSLCRWCHGRAGACEWSGWETQSQKERSGKGVCMCARVSCIMPAFPAHVTPAFLLCFHSHTHLLSLFTPIYFRLDECDSS